MAVLIISLLGLPYFVQARKQTKVHGKDMYRELGMIESTLVFYKKREKRRLTSGGLPLLDTSLVPHFGLSSLTTIDLVTTLDLPETLLCDNLCGTGSLLDGLDVGTTDDV